MFQAARWVDRLILQVQGLIPKARKVDLYEMRIGGAVEVCLDAAHGFAYPDALSANSVHVPALLNTACPCQWQEMLDGARAFDHHPVP